MNYFSRNKKIFAREILFFFSAVALSLVLYLVLNLYNIIQEFRIENTRQTLSDTEKQINTLPESKYSSIIEIDSIYFRVRKSSSNPILEKLNLTGLRKKKESSSGKERVKYDDLGIPIKSGFIAPEKDRQLAKTVPKDDLPDPILEKLNSNTESVKKKKSDPLNILKPKTVSSWDELVGEHDSLTKKVDLRSLIVPSITEFKEMFKDILFRESVFRKEYINISGDSAKHLNELINASLNFDKRIEAKKDSLLTFKTEKTTQVSNIKYSLLDIKQIIEILIWVSGCFLIVLYVLRPLFYLIKWAIKTVRE